MRPTEVLIAPTLYVISLLNALWLQGCDSVAAKPVAQRDRDWQILCANAPFVAGMEVSYAEQRAMTRLDAWKLSVEQVNEACAAR